MEVSETILHASIRRSFGALSIEVDVTGEVSGAEGGQVSMAWSGRGFNSLVDLFTRSKGRGARVLRTGGTTCPLSV
jgi:hypothetical protein